MKKMVLVLLAMCLPGVVTANDWLIYGQAGFPGSETYESEGLGGVQMRTPIAPFGLGNMELGLSAGYGSLCLKGWKFNECIADLEIGGRVDIIPIGLSLIYTVMDKNKFKVSAEGGFQYNICQSNADLHINRIMWFNDLGITNELECDNLWTGSLGANIEIPLSGSMNILVGGGYAWTLTKDSFELAGFELPMEHSLDGAFVRAGLVIRR